MNKYNNGVLTESLNLQEGSKTEYDENNNPISKTKIYKEPAMGIGSGYGGQVKFIVGSVDEFGNTVIPGKVYKDKYGNSYWYAEDGSRISVPGIDTGNSHMADYAYQALVESVLEVLNPVIQSLLNSLCASGMLTVSIDMAAFDSIFKQSSYDNDWGYKYKLKDPNWAGAAGILRFEPNPSYFADQYLGAMCYEDVQDQAFYSDIIAQQEEMMRRFGNDMQAWMSCASDDYPDINDNTLDQEEIAWQLELRKFMRGS